MPPEKVKDVFPIGNRPVSIEWAVTGLLAHGEMSWFTRLGQRGLLGFADWERGNFERM